MLSSSESSDDEIEDLLIHVEHYDYCEDHTNIVKVKNFIDEIIMGFSDDSEQAGSASVFG